MLLITLSAGGLFTWLSTFFVPTTRPHSQFLLSSLTSGYLFLLFYLIVVLEHPFLGGLARRIHFRMNACWKFFADESG